MKHSVLRPAILVLVSRLTRDRSFHVASHAKNKDSHNLEGTQAPKGQLLAQERMETSRRLRSPNAGGREGCAGEPERTLGSDHLLAKQRAAADMRFTKLVCSDPIAAADERWTVAVTDPEVLARFREAFLAARYDGPDLRREGFKAAYETSAGPLVATIEIGAEPPGWSASYDMLYLCVHARQFNVEGYGFAQDGFQSPALARLLREHVVSKETPVDVRRAIDRLSRADGRE